MKPIFCATSEEARFRASETLQVALCKKKRSGIPVLLLLSGGSAFSLLYAEFQDIFGPHMMVGVLDERYSRDESVNNFAEFTKTVLYANALAAGATFIDTRVKEGESQHELAARFEKALRDWIEAHAEGVVIATMGVGSDGHTAGIMPFPENPILFQQLFEDDTKWVTAYDAGNKNPYPLRITVTLPFLRNYVNYAFIYAVGEGKKAAIRRVFAKEGSFIETPARIVHEMRNIQFFTDVSLPSK